jgi:hypothetical protein
MKKFVRTKQAFLFIFLINLFLSLFPKIEYKAIVGHNIFMFGDDHSENDDSASQRKYFLNKIVKKAQTDVVVFIEDIGVQIDDDLLSGLCKNIESLENPNIKVINVEKRFFLSHTIKFFDPYLQPPFQSFSPKKAIKNRKKYNCYEMSFKDLFKEINRLADYKEELENKNKRRLWNEYKKELYRSKNILREILKKNYIFLEDSVLETAMFSYLYTLQMVSETEEQKKELQDIESAYELFLENYPDNLSEKEWEKQYSKIDRLIASFIERYFSNYRTEADFTPLRDQIIKLLVKIDEAVFDTAVFYRIISHIKKDVPIIVLMGSGHIKSLADFFGSVGFKVEPYDYLKKPFACLDVVV